MTPDDYYFITPAQKWGGQHTGSDTRVVCIHRPTGIAFMSEERSLMQGKDNSRKSCEEIVARMALTTYCTCGHSKNQHDEHGCCMCSCPMPEEDV